MRKETAADNGGLAAGQAAEKAADASHERNSGSWKVTVACCSDLLVDHGCFFMFLIFPRLKKNLEIACKPPAGACVHGRTSHVTPKFVLPKQSKLSFFESQRSKHNCCFGPVSQAKSM
jgi:hypothetical protein